MDAAGVGSAVTVNEADAEQFPFETVREYPVVVAGTTLTEEVVCPVLQE